MQSNFQAVSQIRAAALANGYTLVRVKTADKMPIAANWPNGESPDTLFKVTTNTANTGIVCRGLRVVDIDVDDWRTVTTVIGLIKQFLPPGAPIRKRKNSSRLALLYRAAKGTPAKKVMAGDLGKIEVLGIGQQLVAFGTHPSGAELEWVRGRSPATLAFASLPEVEECQIDSFLSACQVYLKLAPDCLEHSPPATIQPVDNSDLGYAPADWFDALTPDKKVALVKLCLTSLPNAGYDPRPFWLKIIFAVADAERRGCRDGRALALEWSKRGSGWTSQQDFDVAWNSARNGEITVGTLIYFARQQGADLPSWAGAAPAALQKSEGALHLGDIKSIPKKRQWLHGTDVVRGAITLMAAPGGRGKSSWLILLAIALASNRKLLGAPVFGGPLRVLYINAEDTSAEITLRFFAALQHHGIPADKVAGLSFAGTDTADITLLRQNQSATLLNDVGYRKLRTLLDAECPDVVIIDPLVSVMGGVSLNDNAAASVLMKNLAMLAAEYNIGMVLAHHTSKGRDASTADAAMGAASYVNLARIGLSIEKLAAEEAIRLGVPPMQRHAIFRVGSTKQNLSAPNSNERLFRLVSVEVANSQPPIYPYGDRVGVVEAFTPLAHASFSQSILDAAIAAIAVAKPPLSPSPRNFESTCQAVAQAMATASGHVHSAAEAAAVLEQLRRTGKVAVQTVKVSRPGRKSTYPREGFVAV